MGHKNPTPVPHSEREAVLGCIDGRLVLPHFMRSMHFKSSEFLIRMAGGAAALLTERDARSCIGQLTDAYGVRPFDQMEIQLHLGCGKLKALCEKGGEFEGRYDPHSTDSLYDLGRDAAQRVAAEFRSQLKIHMPISITVVDIHKKLGLPAAKIMPPSGQIGKELTQTTFRRS